MHAKRDWIEFLFATHPMVRPGFAGAKRVQDQRTIEEEVLLSRRAVSPKFSRHQFVAHTKVQRKLTELSPQQLQVQQHLFLLAGAVFPSILTDKPTCLVAHIEQCLAQPAILRPPELVRGFPFSAISYILEFRLKLQ